MENAKLNYKSFGEGETVIILHGLLGMLDNWQSFARNFEEGYRVITLDQRNHGKSFHSDQIDYPLLARDLMEFMDAENIPSAHLVGHSMGGKTVLQFLNDYPGRVGKAVCVDMSPVRHEGGHEEIFKALLKLDVNAISGRKEAFEFLKSELKSDTIVHFLLKNLARSKDGNYKWKANIKGLWDNYNKILEPVTRTEPYKGEILFVRGSRSDYIGTEAMETIAGDYPEHELVTIEGAGHWVHADQPDELKTALLEFLRK